MGQFEKTQITKQGRELLAKAIKGAELKFTRAAMGSGSCDGNFDLYEDLIKHELDGNIISIDIIGDGCVNLKCKFDNSTVSESFLFMELGLFAYDPDIGEILYCYTHVKDVVMADYISSNNNMALLEEEITIGTWIRNAENITAIISKSSNAVEISYNGMHTDFGINVNDVIDSFGSLLKNFIVASSDEVPQENTKLHFKVLKKVFDWTTPVFTIEENEKTNKIKLQIEGGALVDGIIKMENGILVDGVLETENCVLGIKI